MNLSFETKVFDCNILSNKFKRNADGQNPLNKNFGHLREISVKNL